MNPYEILGVSENADEETVKKAYRELVKKYHPDRYINNPLADIAAEKMKEINRAYDMIENHETVSRTAQSYSNQKTYTDSSGTGEYRGEAPSFSEVRQLLDLNLITDAVAMLQKLPRNAEWYYLSGIADIRSGRYNNAINHIKMAVSMEPDNPEYKDALDALNNRASHYDAEEKKYISDDTATTVCGLCCGLIYTSPYLCIGGCICKYICLPLWC